MKTKNQINKIINIIKKLSARPVKLINLKKILYLFNKLNFE